MPYQQILGQERPKYLLKEALKRNRLHHAYLFWGPAGVGKRTMARALAGALNCLSPQEGEGCGQCLACQKTRRGNHPDYLYLEVEADKSFISIDQVRALQSFLAYKPYEGLRKVAVIGEADKMREEAASALLKTLEEPPPHSHLVLVVPNPSFLLPTVISRCQLIGFTSLPLPLVEKELERRLKVSPAQAALMACLSEGSLGAALELNPKVLLSERDRIINAWEAMEKGKLSAAQDLAEEWGKKRETTREFLHLLLLWHRDLLAARWGAPASVLFNPDQAEKLKSRAGEHSRYEWLRRLILLRRAYEAVEAFANTKLVWGALFVNVRRGTHQP